MTELQRKTIEKAIENYIEYCSIDESIRQSKQELKEHIKFMKRKKKRLRGKIVEQRNFLKRYRVTDKKFCEEIGIKPMTLRTWINKAT